MCGIVGQYEFEKTGQVDRESLKRSCDLMRHRGPDDEGFYLNGNIGLGMRRLSIIDLSQGHQPIHNEDKTIWVVFNGEIYNFQELRKDLEKCRHAFYTNSDTEVLVHLYEEEGLAFVNKLNGMFAFALWDQPGETLLLVRDRLGIKPLFYYVDHQRLLFGSEIKAILKNPKIEVSIDFSALHNYLSLNSIPAPQTIYNNIKKLLPGYLLVCCQGRVEVKDYWDVDFSQKRVHYPVEFYTETVLELLREAIKRRMISDVPLGVLLSGGIDSSAIVALMSEFSTTPIKTFSVGFDEQSYNELPFARQVAKRFGTQHHEMIVKPHVAELFETIIWHFEEPYADNSAFPTYYISQLAKNYVTVILSGEGGDEVFAGYDTYTADLLANFYRRLPEIFKSNLLPLVVRSLPVSEKKVSFDYKAKRFVKGALLPPEAAHFHWKVIFDEGEKHQLYAPEIRQLVSEMDSYAVYDHYYKKTHAEDTLDKLFYVDAKTWLANDCLVKVDRMTMANSQEARVPFLDHTLVEFAATIPAAIKMRYFQKKYLLKKALKNILPKGILHRPKKGFIMPVNVWLKEELRPLCLDLLSPAQIKKVGFFNPQTVSTLLEEHFHGVQDHSRKIWALLNFMFWYDLFIDHPHF